MGRLKDWLKTVHWSTWKPNGQNRKGSRWAQQKDLWYSNDNDFKREISGFNKNDKYVMRFSGQYYAGKDARYQFQTRSDDGSLLFVDEHLIVDNDGNHGMRIRNGWIALTKGWH